MTPIVLSLSRKFSAAHRLWSDDSKCRNIHGHNYSVAVKVTGEPSEDGFVVAFDKVKEVIDYLDHTLILHREDPILKVWRSNPPAIEDDFMVTETADLPTTECLAQMIANHIKYHLHDPQASVWVSLRETDSIEAQATA